MASHDWVNFNLKSFPPPRLRSRIAVPVRPRLRRVLPSILPGDRSQCRALSCCHAGPANILRLYTCEDSSLCRVSCKDVATCGCAAASAKSECCYPLSDGSVWAFTEFECREFSSWVKNWSAAAGAALGRVGMVTCTDGAVLVNATAVRGGMRCAYNTGLIGDGFARGTVCSKGTCILSMTMPAVCHASNHCEFENF
uniref:Uncharacterized protein n=1 Tax=Oryza meridionalis TaxID=40149 RepID=A0A0E0DHL6_9ORYZ